ncbi:hypothetical protein IMCC3317_34250 [Kordia antarctica]|uniref:D-alanyl-D-alanine carboxypeptidase n=1 Tax=Kordia antarctica TaxID=1218801 RepID=A0A7L4ZNG7_9FLAO|nr:hypothetical protein [Kordia antarctica]QHI38041.1 hypothetical protein IMCC3317_34250 [Kordia antarctica]
MAVYKFSNKLKKNDVDKTTYERHLTGEEDSNVLDKNYIHKIQERFHELGFGYMVGNINGCFNIKLYATILAFQIQAKSQKRNIYNFFSEKEYTEKINITFLGQVNGVFDNETAKELSLWLENNYRNSCDVPLVKWGKTWIRSETSEKIEKIKSKVLGLGGIFPINSIACFRNPANTTISKGMKKTSLHLAALAIDLDEWRGMQDPDTDYYYIADRDGEYWDVFVKSKLKNNTLKKDFTFYDFDKRQYYNKTLEGGFINISKLFEEQAMIPIRRKMGWEREYYLTEWWHFQRINTDDSIWQKEMNKIGYINKFLKKQNYI